MKIEIVKGSLLEAQADLIVNPANSAGVMGGGVAGAIRRAAGSEVEAEAIAKAPIPVGGAALTSGGKSRFKGILHAPTMTRPAEAIPVENVRKAVRAALALSDAKGAKILAFPGMGTGVGRVSPRSAAEAMIEEMLAFQSKSIEKIILVDVNDEMTAAWRTALSKQKR
ncbi:MAG TPA: macro domain-containing protein [Candidatus Manganitrophaceae bacterium]|nr:macro domain-containing protein [Candidatus Manganitrophaceae bacterium]